MHLSVGFIMFIRMTAKFISTTEMKTLEEYR